MGLKVLALAGACLLSAPVAQADLYIELDGNIQQQYGGDWHYNVAGQGYDKTGQVSAKFGYEWRDLSVYTGLTHTSLPEYGHDGGFNAVIVGVSYRIRFDK